MTTPNLISRWTWYILLVLTGLFIFSGGCPPRPDDGGNTGGQTDNGGTTDGNNQGNGTADGNADGTNSGGQTDNGGSTDTNGDGTGTDTNGDGTGGSTDNGSGSGGSGGGSTNGGSGSGSGGGSTNNGSGSGGGNNGGSSGGSTQPPPPPTAISLTQIAKTGQHVPGQPDTVGFVAFGNPVIDAQGRVAFWATYRGLQARGDAGLYVWNGQTTQRVLDNDPNTAGVVPGPSTPHYFGHSGTNDPLTFDLSWAGGNRLLFVSEIIPASGPAGNARMGVYRWRVTDGSFVRVADWEQVAHTFPDVSEGSSGPSFQANSVSLPGVSDDGLAIFGMNYTYISTEGEGLERFIIEKNGVFTSNGTTVTLIASDSTKTTGVVPDQPASAYFTSISPLTTLNADGDMLFRGAFASGSSGASQGVYLLHDGTAYRVIDNRTNPSWPGLAAGARVAPRSPSLGYGFAIGPAGHIAIAGKLTVAGTTNPAVLMWDWDAGKWTVLYGPSSTPATAMLTGVNDDGQVGILAGGTPYIATTDSLVPVTTNLPVSLYGVTLVWSDTGGSINNYGRAVLAYTGDGQKGLAFWTTARLLVVADVRLGIPAGIADIQTITGPERDRPGRSGMLNDADQLVFRAVMSDASQAIYLARGE